MTDKSELLTFEKRAQKLGEWFAEYADHHRAKAKQIEALPGSEAWAKVERNLERARFAYTLQDDLASHEALAAQPRDDVRELMEALRGMVAIQDRMEEEGCCDSDFIDPRVDEARRVLARIDTALAPTTQGTERQPETYAEWQQKRGRLADKRDEIVSILADHYDFRAQNGATIDGGVHKGAVNRIFAALTQPDTQGTDSGLAEDARNMSALLDCKCGRAECTFIVAKKVIEAQAAALRTRTDRKAVLEEAAKVAEEWAEGCAQERGNAGAMNDRHRVWQKEAERQASTAIAQAIRALAEGAGK